jgi:hypothetical protein
MLASHRLGLHVFLLWILLPPCSSSRRLPASVLGFFIFSEDIIELLVLVLRFLVRVKLIFGVQCMYKYAYIPLWMQVLHKGLRGLLLSCTINQSFNYQSAHPDRPKRCACIYLALGMAFVKTVNNAVLYSKLVDASLH